MSVREPRVGEWVKVITRSIPELWDKEVKVTKVNWATLDVRLYRGREDYSLTRQDIQYLEPEQIVSAEKKEIVKRLVRSDSLIGFKMLNKQIGLLNKLFEKYPDPNFWREFDPGYMVQSLEWFLTGGSNDLVTQYNKSTLDFHAKSINIGTVKLGEDAKITKTKPNLQGWLEN